MHIWTIQSKEEKNLLRTKMARFDFDKIPIKELKKIIKEMRILMKKVRGVGLSANQIGLNMNFFIAQVENKFYAIFNPKITKIDEEKIELEEGCLSVPEVYGLIKRSSKITLECQDISGKKIKIKAWGLLAQVFQHEVGHLNGELFIDKTSQTYKVTSNPKS